VRHLAHALLHGAAVVLPHVSAGRWTVAHGQPAMPYVVLDARGEVIASMPDAFDAVLYLAQRHTADAWRWLEARGIAPHTEPSQEALEAVEAAAHTGSLAALVQATCAHFDVHPTVMLAGRHVPAHLAVNMDGVGVVWFGRALISRARASGAWIIYHNTQRTEHDPAEMARELCNLCLRLEHKP
jgi:hypothetical protein